MAISATLHCLTGCAIGEVLGLIIGAGFGLENGATTLVAIALAFLFGFGLSTLPLVKTGMAFVTALSIVFAADTREIRACAFGAEQMRTVVDEFIRRRDRRVYTFPA